MSLVRAKQMGRIQGDIKMINHFQVSSLRVAAAIGAVVLSSAAHSAPPNVSDDFTQANDPNQWQAFDGACLTAGDGTGTIPTCIGLPYYGGQVQYGGSQGFLGQNTNPGAG